MLSAMLGRLTGRREGSAAFPPYRLLERDYLEEAQAKYRRLERLYHVGHKKAWDGKEVLSGLLQKHGGVRLAEDKKKAIARIFSVILWGELAAWNVSADIAELLEDTEAKMAASGQVFDEARHFYTMRDYLLELGVEIPPLDALTRAVLVDLLETGDVLEKLIGMQLLVENIAVHLFQAVAGSGVEPVLSELMPYFERDEARHVGLGVLYLPERLEQVGRRDALRLQLFQIKATTLVLWAVVLLRDSLEALGVDLNRTFQLAFKNQIELVASMRRFKGRTKGIYDLGGPMRAINEQVIRLFFPPKDASVPKWLRFGHRVLYEIALRGERVVEWAS